MSTAQSSEVVKFTIQVGALFRGAIRNYLHTAQHRGLPVTWTEGSGWITRPFFITAPQWIHDDLRAKIQTINAE